MRLTKPELREHGWYVFVSRDDMNTLDEIRLRLGDHPFVKEIERWRSVNCPKDVLEFENGAFLFRNEEDAMLCYLAFS